MMDNSSTNGRMLFGLCIFITTLAVLLGSSSHETCDIVNQTANCSFKSLHNVPQDLPDTLTTLLLKGNHIKLGPVAFRRYSVLRHLDISSNELKDIGNGTFGELQNLITLNLEDNSLDLTSAVYRPEVFNGLCRLEALNIGGNFEAFGSAIPFSYPAHAIAHLSSLKNLTVDGIPGKMFEEGFEKLHNLTKLIFGKYCFIWYINESMFDNIPYLTILDMSDCHITDIHRNAFFRLPNIDTLDLSRNTGLGFDRVTSALYGLQNTSIRVLRLNNIVLPYASCVIPSNDSFRYLQNTSIKELHIDHNNIDRLLPNTFQFYPPTLEFISAIDNRFTVGYYSLELQNVKGLKRIDVSDMAIAHFGKLPNVGESRINGYTSLHTIPLPTPPDIEDITAKNCIIAAAIENLTFFSPNKVKNVYLSQNVIKSWTGPVKGLETVERVDLSMNFCSNVSYTFFKHFPNIKMLNVSDNFLGEAFEDDKYSHVLHPLYQLDLLDLSRNRFRKIHKLMFQNNTILQHLNLSNNQIEECNFDISSLKELQTINLNGNQIRYLHKEFRESLDYFQKRRNISIDISNNPLACTCENINFLRWFLDTSVRFLRFDEYTCIDEDLKKKRLDCPLLDTMVTKCKSYIGLMCGLGSVFIFLMALIVFGILYRYRWKVKYLYYVARDRYLQNGRRSAEDKHFEFDAFISFANEDIEFVNTLTERLEGERTRLCVHHRDFRPGEPIGANVVRAVQTSRRCVLVLSSNFLTSNWCRYEFEMARMESVYEERRVIIVLKIEDIDDADLPRELLYMMKSNSYLEWPDSVEEQETFWFSLDRIIEAE